jgi:hypothetical protein
MVDHVVRAPGQQKEPRAEGCEPANEEKNFEDRHVIALGIGYHAGLKEDSTIRILKTRMKTSIRDR